MTHNAVVMMVSAIVRQHLMAIFHAETVGMLTDDAVVATNYAEVATTLLADAQRHLTVMVVMLTMTKATSVEGKQ